MMTRALTAIALLLAMSACSRTAQNTATNSVTTSNAAATPNASAPAPAPAPAPQASVANQADAPTEEGDIAAGREQGPRPTPDQETREGCAGEIGLEKARELVLQCRDVSPATRPPCNTANSCELIQSEIDRGCRMLGEDAPPFCVPR
jgi:hypothetical protein